MLNRRSMPSGRASVLARLPLCNPLNTRSDRDLFTCAGAPAVESSSVAEATGEECDGPLSIGVVPSVTWGKLLETIPNSRSTALQLETINL